MLTYLTSAGPARLKAPDRLYVAVTRARHSVAFVVDRRDATYAMPPQYADDQHWNLTEHPVMQTATAEEQPSAQPLEGTAIRR